MSHGEPPAAGAGALSGWPENAIRISYLAGFPLVVCALLGAGHGLDPSTGTLPGAVAGAALGLTASRKHESTWARPIAVVLLGLAPLLLPQLDRLAGLAGAAFGLSVVSSLIAAAIVWLLCGIVAPRVGPVRPPGAAAAFVVAAGLLPAAYLALPRLGLVSCGLLGAVLLLPAAFRPSAGPAVEPDRVAPTSQFAGGVVLGACLPLLFLASGPFFGPTPGWFAEGLTGLALGLGIGAVVALRRPGLAAVRAAFAPALCLGAAELLLRSPEAVGALLSRGLPALAAGSPLAPGLLTIAAGLLLGLAAHLRGRATGWGIAAGAALWLLLPDLLHDPAVLARAAVAAVALATVPTVLQAERMALRGTAAVACAAALGALALPSPPGGLRALEPYTTFAEPGGLGRLTMAAGWRTGEARVHARGSAAVLDDLSPSALWSRGRASRLDDSQRGSDLFMGHLPGLLRGDPPGSVLVLSDGAGALVDAARRASGGTITVAAASPGGRWLLEHYGAWSRDVVADPAVRLLRVDPLAGGATWSAVLVDLPPAWAPGGPAAHSPARFRAIARHLDVDGVAVFRLPLSRLEADELAAVTSAIADEFAGVTAWLDPTGATHLLLAARPHEGPVDAGAVYRAWSRRVVASDLQRASLASPADALERLITDRAALEVMAAGRHRRDRYGTAVVAGARVRAGRGSMALTTVAAAGAQVEDLLDFSGVPAAELGSLQERLTSAAAIRSDYLAMLQAIEEGDSATALATSQAIAERGGTAAARDLRTFIVPWVERCRSLRRQALYEQARGECLIAHSFSPTDDDVALLLADLYRMLDQPADAAELYEAVRERDPTSLGAALGLAAVADLQGDLLGVIQLLEEAEKLHSGNALLLNNLAAAHLRFAKTRTTDEEAAPHVGRARALFQNASSLEPRFPEPRAGLADLYSFEQQYEKALIEIDKAVAMSPTCRFRAQRGQALFDTGQTREADTLVEAVLLECPDELGALILKGVLLASRGCYLQAYEQWGRAEQVAPDLQIATDNRTLMERSGLLERGDQDCRQ